MKTVKYKNYVITRFASGTIEVTKNGHIVSPVKPHLRELAKELNISIENANGNPHITRQLGVLIMRAIEEKHSKNCTEPSIGSDNKYTSQNTPKVSFVNAIKEIIANSPKTPQEIREEIKHNYPYLYGTEVHQRNVEKGHYQDIPHAVLAQIYSQTKNNKNFLIDKTTKPLTIGLNKHIKSSTTSFNELMDYYFSRNKHGFFYLNKKERIEQALTENDTPNHYGVYIIYSVKDDKENIIYIGKAGSIMTNGDFKSQGIKNRLKAAGPNNIQRGKYFQQEVIQKYGFDKLKFVWIVTYDNINKELPSYSEARLMQSYFDNYNRLPMLNKSF